jgi:hypothetical protein
MSIFPATIRRSVYGGGSQWQGIGKVREAFDRRRFKAYSFHVRASEVQRSLDTSIDVMQRLIHIHRAVLGALWSCQNRSRQEIVAVLQRRRRKTAPCRA